VARIWHQISIDTIKIDYVAHQGMLNAVAMQSGMWKGSMMKEYYTMIARYNRWANTRLYGMAARLSDEQYRRNVGAYFGSLHHTLNHLLSADRIWMRRLTGAGDHPDRLNAVLFDDLVSLRTAREAEDARIVTFIDGLCEADFEKQRDYQTLNGTRQRQPLGEILAHLFNHQTHHRGQAHTVLTILGVVEPDPLDLLVMLREESLATFRSEQTVRP
jgi:uncharacterized damage-inducible protein DinB